MSKIAFNSNPSGTGTFTIASPNSNTDRTLTLPDTTGTVLTSAGGTLTGDLNVNTKITAGLGAGDNLIINDGIISARWSLATGGYNLRFRKSDEFGVFQDQVQIDASGRVTMPYQPHIFGSLTNTGGSGIANSFNSILSQGGLAFVTNRITVPVAGLYLVTFNTICDSSSGRIDSSILINGVARLTQLNEDNGSGFHYRSASAVFRLAASDYIQFNNNDWYNPTVTSYDTWRTASVTLIG